FSELNPSTGTDGDIWLTATLAGVETIELNLTNGQISATDLEFDVTGGLFAENFDQNFFGGNDFVTFSFQTFGQSDPGSVSLFNGATNTRFFAIPEPSTVGLLGLGLVGLGMVSRRRKS
ncbi:MAG: PEP-CTERM sorting domain-containing protein, partial [Sphingomonadales bacterium]